jgi:hypothetical protein
MPGEAETLKTPDKFSGSLRTGAPNRRGNPIQPRALRLVAVEGKSVLSDRDDAAEYRTCAEECAAMAQAIADPAHRVALLQMAQAWMRLAEKAEQKTSIIA